MTEHILFLTGNLAEKQLHKVLESLPAPGFTYEVKNIGVSVAALMTAGMISRRLNTVTGYSKVIVPGLCRGNLDETANVLGVPVIRACDDLKDLPAYFGHAGKKPDLSKHGVTIFAEIVEAPDLSVEEILDRALQYKQDGADIIDIGCLPDTPFPHLEESVKLLKQEGFTVSVDSLVEEELLRGGRSGADYLLSLKESTLWICEEVDATPVLIPEEHTELNSLYRAIEHCQKNDRRFIADSILDPVHFGFTESINRYQQLSTSYPGIEIMMGVGNITELTEADTTGINAILFGIISELGINHVLTTQVSPHARSVVRESDRARRIMYAAKEHNSLPKGLDNALLAVHDRKPFPYTAGEISELASGVRDPSYRIQVSEEGIHVFNRDGIVTGRDIFSLFPQLNLLQDDAPHAFYMGVELAKAQIAFNIGKRYVQDQELNWGAAAVKNETDNHAAHKMKSPQAEYSEPGSTLKAKRKKKVS